MPIKSIEAVALYQSAITEQNKVFQKFTDKTLSKIFDTIRTCARRGENEFPYYIFFEEENEPLRARIELHIKNVLINLGYHVELKKFNDSTQFNISFDVD